MNKFQFTFFDETGKNKPVACILETEKNFVEIIKSEKEFRLMAIKKICTKRSWTVADFKSYGYSKFKYRRVKES